MISSLVKFTEVSIILRKQWESFEQVCPNSAMWSAPNSAGLSQLKQYKQALIFMIQEADSKQLKFPDRQEITLCEAVTAFVCGKASDALQYMLHGEAGTTQDQSAKAKDLIERSHSAAYAGRITFRALKHES
jgi:hypothetical protein